MVKSTAETFQKCLISPFLFDSFFFKNYNFQECRKKSTNYGATITSLRKKQKAKEEIQNQRSYFTQKSEFPALIQTGLHG